MLTPLDKKVMGMAVVFDAAEKRALLERVGRIADSGYFLWGDQQEEFQRRFADLTRRRHALVFSSTTSVLEYVFRWLQSAPTRFGGTLKVGFQGNAFPSVVFAARRAGCEVYFADIEIDTGAPSLQDWMALHSDVRLDVLVHQHTGGRMAADWPETVTWARAEGIKVIEDSSQAAGSSYGSVVAGQLGDVALFSTSATKALHTGQGSVLVTDDSELAQHVERVRQYGRTQMFQAGEFVVEGGNISQSEMNAAVGNVMLDTMADRRDYRAHIADIFTAGLGDVLDFPVVGGKPNWYKQPAMLPRGLDRKELKAKLVGEGNVQLGSEVYDFVTPYLDVFDGEFERVEVPRTVDWAASHVCLPVHNVITSWEAEQVVRQVQQAVAELRVPA